MLPHRTHRFLIVFTCLLLCIPLGSWRSPQEGIIERGYLRIFPGNLSGAMSICKDSEFLINLVVKNAPRGIDLDLPVADAHVTVVDNTGRREVASTGRDGLMRMTWPTDQEGTFTLTATAAKKDYVSSPPYKFIIRIISCRWELGVNFVEEYYIVKESNLVVGAVTRWDGVLDAGEAGGDEGDGGIRKVQLVDAMGHFAFYARDEIQAPFHFSLESPVEGPWNLNASGTVQNGILSLKLGEDAVSYPQVIKLKTTDTSNLVSDRNLTVNYAPPVATASGNGMVLSLNKIWTAEFPTSGGEIRLTSGAPIYLQMPEQSKYLLVLYLKPFKTTSSYCPLEAGREMALEVQP